MNLLDVRPKLAAALAPALDSDPNVLVGLVDAIEPPALMLGWGDPMLTPDTSCFATGRVVVTAIGSRLMPGEGVTMLEELIDYTITRLRLDGPDWVLETVSAPRVYIIAKTNYIASRIQIKVMVS
jgi:hypothetical protein